MNAEAEELFISYIKENLLKHEDDFEIKVDPTFEFYYSHHPIILVSAKPQTGYYNGLDIIRNNINCFSIRFYNNSSSYFIFDRGVNKIVIEKPFSGSFIYIAIFVNSFKDLIKVFDLDSNYIKKIVDKVNQDKKDIQNRIILLIILLTFL